MTIIILTATDIRQLRIGWRLFFRWRGVLRQVQRAHSEDTVDVYIGPMRIMRW